MNFKIFSQKIRDKFDIMSKHDLFIVNIGKDEAYEAYLDAFPLGTNDIYKERREHDCTQCRNFIRNIGNVVAIIEGKKVSVWDIDVDNEYKIVSKIMSDKIQDALILDIFRHEEVKISIPHSIQDLGEGNTKKWYHMSCELPSKFVTSEVASIKGKARSRAQVFKRGLETLTLDSIDSVLDLINADNIYRGSEHKERITAFRELVMFYGVVIDKDIFVWANYTNKWSDTRNTVIGNLLQNISEGMDLEAAVRAFEIQVAPANYKRTSGVVTKGMIKTAISKIDELGYEPAIHRRFANSRDISVNNVLFVDRSVTMLDKNPLESLLDDVVKPKKPANADNLKIIKIEDFMENIVPKSKSIEVLVDNKHLSNMVSLVAPIDTEAANILAWDNNFSWSYAGNMTDSDIKARVKSAGGKVDGDVRISLSWFNTDDLDIQVMEPSGVMINFNNKNSHRTKGALDVDMNVRDLVRNAVENITYENRGNMDIGNYRVRVNNYTKRENIDVGCVIEIEIDGVISTFNYEKAIRNQDTIDIVDFEFDGQGLTFKPAKGVTSDETSKEEWGIKTQDFQKVSMMLLSPNYWDGQTNGNKHYFFMLDKCINPEPTRGLYNEFLNGKLTPHRKVMDILADKLKTKPTDDQLSGLGFSSTQRNEVVVRVDGEIKNTMRVAF